MFVLLIETKGDDGVPSSRVETRLRAGDEVLWHEGKLHFFRRLSTEETTRYRRVRRTMLAELTVQTGDGVQDTLALPIPRSVDACAEMIIRYGDQMPELRAWSWAQLGLLERLPGRQRFRVCGRPP